MRECNTGELCEMDYYTMYIVSAHIQTCIVHFCFLSTEDMSCVYIRSHVHNIYHHTYTAYNVCHVHCIYMYVHVHVHVCTLYTCMYTYTCTYTCTCIIIIHDVQCVYVYRGALTYSVIVGESEWLVSVETSKRHQMETSIH